MQRPARVEVRARTLPWTRASGPRPRSSSIRRAGARCASWPTRRPASDGTSRRRERAADVNEPEVNEPLEIEVKRSVAQPSVAQRRLARSAPEDLAGFAREGRLRRVEVLDR